MRLAEMLDVLVDRYHVSACKAADMVRSYSLDRMKYRSRDDLNQHLDWMERVFSEAALMEVEHE